MIKHFLKEILNVTHSLKGIGKENFHTIHFHTKMLSIMDSLKEILNYIDSLRTSLRESLIALSSLMTTTI